jgi:hypothetical protein
VPSAKALLVASLFTALAAPSLRAEQLSQGFPSDVVVHLASAKEIYIATERKSGKRSAVAPVWFAVVDNAIWFATSPASNKAKRVAHGSPMYVSVDGKNGPFMKTKAEIVKDGAMADRLGEIYAKKYWLAWLGMYRPSRTRLETGQIVLIKLTPAD